MIFTVGVVPECLCVGVVTPVLKKGKPLSQCSSYRPITVSSVFSKIFELLIIDHTYSSTVRHASFLVWVSTAYWLLPRFKEFMYNIKGC